jgi:hypothetical protein
VDANSIDPGADEAVQRIQTSLRKMDAKTKATRAAIASQTALTGMLEALSVSADEATKNSEEYQSLAAQPHVTAVLSEAVHQMTSIAVNVSKVLRDKHGIQIDRPGYKIIKALAWHNESITEEAKSRNDPNWSARGVWEIERILRGKPYLTEPQRADAGRDIKSALDQHDEELVDEEENLDPDTEPWDKHVAPAEQTKAAGKSSEAPEMEWKMNNRGGW